MGFLQHKNINIVSSDVTTSFIIQILFIATCQYEISMIISVHFPYPYSTAIITSTSLSSCVCMEFNLIWKNLLYFIRNIIAHLGNFSASAVKRSRIAISRLRFFFSFSSSDWHKIFAC